LPEDWKSSVIVPIYKKGDKTELSNYIELSNPSTTCKILSNTLLSRLTPCAVEIIGDYQCGFQRKVQLLIIYCEFVKQFKGIGKK